MLFKICRQPVGIGTILIHYSINNNISKHFNIILQQEDVLVHWTQVSLHTDLNAYDTY